MNPRSDISSKELELNKNYVKETSSGLIPCFDIPNHVFPKEENLKDLNIFHLVPNNKMLRFSFELKINNNTEYGYAYSPQVYSAHMILAYGFTILDNEGENILSNMPTVYSFSISFMK